MVGRGGSVGGSSEGWQGYSEHSPGKAVGRTCQHGEASPEQAAAGRGPSGGWFELRLERIAGTPGAGTGREVVRVVQAGCSWPAHALRWSLRLHRCGDGPWPDRIAWAVPHYSQLLCCTYSSVGQGCKDHKPPMSRCRSHPSLRPLSRRVVGWERSSEVLSQRKTASFLAGQSLAAVRGAGGSARVCSLSCVVSPLLLLLRVSPGLGV